MALTSTDLSLQATELRLRCAFCLLRSWWHRVRGATLALQCYMWIHYCGGNYLPVVSSRAELQQMKEAHRVINPQRCGNDILIRSKCNTAVVFEHRSVDCLIVLAHPTSHSLPIACLIPPNRQPQQYLLP